MRMYLKIYSRLTFWISDMCVNKNNFKSSPPNFKYSFISSTVWIEFSVKDARFGVTKSAPLRVGLFRPFHVVIVIVLFTTTRVPLVVVKQNKHKGAFCNNKLRWILIFARLFSTLRFEFSFSNFSSGILAVNEF